MNNYQEWGDPPIVLKDTDKTKPIDEHIEPDFYDSKHHTEYLKSSIRGLKQITSLFNSRY